MGNIQARADARIPHLPKDNREEPRTGSDIHSFQHFILAGSVSENTSFHAARSVVSESSARTLSLYAFDS